MILQKHLMTFRNVPDASVATSASAPGKIILSGEYAVVFGYPGIAVPASLRMTATWTPDEKRIIDWPEVNFSDAWLHYINTILDLCHAEPGTLAIKNQLPLQKGMGSSTALIIAVCRSVLGPNCREQALAIEDELNPGHSGIDFNVIWEETAVKFSKKEGATPIALSPSLLDGAFLLDTGAPNETTPELVAMVQYYEEDFKEIFEKIGACTNRIAAGEDLQAVIRDHHRAQVVLGVVPSDVQDMIQKIEDAGGAAKVIGAGGKTGGAGVVLALGVDEDLIKSLETPILATL